MFDNLWTIIEPFPWYVHNPLHVIEVLVPASHYRRVREALYLHAAKYPGEQFILTLDEL